MKKLYALSLVGCLLFGVFIGNHSNNQVVNTSKYYNSQVEFYDDVMENIDTVQIYDTCDLTLETLGNRDGKIIIEKVIGKVTTDDLDGTIINRGKNNYGYISYKRVDGAKKGDIILTYFIYNPLTSEVDDVMTRTDFIIDGNSL